VHRPGAFVIRCERPEGGLLLWKTDNSPLAIPLHCGVRLTFRSRISRVTVGSVELSLVGLILAFRVRYGGMFDVGSVRLPSVTTVIGF